MASLFVIQGADQGKRFELKGRPMALGRDGSNPIRLHDNEVSRRHAEVRQGEDTFASWISALPTARSSTAGRSTRRRSAGRSAPRRPDGDALQRGGPAPERDLTARVDLLGRPAPRIARPSSAASRPATARACWRPPGSAGEWLKVRLANLAVMYQATQAISHITDVDALLPQILAARLRLHRRRPGAILMADDTGELQPKAVLWKGEADPDERMTISRTIVDHVREQGQGVITSDASGDKRFGPAQSIVDYAIREAICVPIQGRHTTLGVLYADIRASSEFGADRWRGRRSRAGSRRTISR